MSKRPQTVTDLPDVTGIPEEPSVHAEGAVPESVTEAAEDMGGMSEVPAGKGLLRPLVIGAILLVLFLLVAFLRSTAAPLIRADRALRWLSVAEVVLMVLFLGLVGYSVSKEVRAYLRITRVQTLREAATEWVGPAQVGTREKFRKRLGSYLAELRTRRPAAYREQVRIIHKRMSEIPDPEEWTDTFNHFLLREMDEEARRVIIQEAVGVGTTTALSPRGLIDVSIVLWRNTRMINRIARIYVGRPGRYGTWVLLRGCLASVALAQTAESLTDLLPAALPLKGLGMMGQCIANAVMTCRVGLQAQRRCRPLPLDASEKPVRDLVKEAVRRVGKRVKRDVRESG